MTGPQEHSPEENPTESDVLVLERLIWERWNVEHIARHDVTPSEVEQVCHGEFLVRRSFWDRLILLGPTKGDRILAVVLEPVERGVYYPITTRPASRKERRYFQAWKEGKDK